MKYEFTVFGQPTGKGRPRFTKTGHTYTPEKTKNYEELVRFAFISSYLDSTKEANKPKPIENPVQAQILAYFEIPKSYSKKKREKCLENKLPATNKPDTDNIAKIILDSLNGYAYVDDKQVIDLTVTKLWSDIPRVEVIINELRCRDE